MLVQECYVGVLDAVPVSVRIDGVYSRCSATREEGRNNLLESSTLHEFGTKSVSSNIFCMLESLSPPIFTALPTNLVDACLVRLARRMLENLWKDVREGKQSPGNAVELMDWVQRIWEG